jgi:SAM-dependent methyltransferase
MAFPYSQAKEASLSETPADPQAQELSLHSLGGTSDKDSRTLEVSPLAPGENIELDESDKISSPNGEEEGQVNEATDSALKGSEGESTTIPDPSHQSFAEDDPTQHAASSAHAASFYSTGLDIDSNQTETDHSDADSAIGSSVYSSTESTRSSVYDYVEENGRTYHRFKQGKYHLPNDEVSSYFSPIGLIYLEHLEVEKAPGLVHLLQLWHPGSNSHAIQIEKDRLDLQHHLCALTFESLYLAPIENLEGGLHNVLDLATGTGIWAIEFAEQFPSAHVIGTDLSPIQPAYVPPNCHFVVDDAEDPWLFSHNFDYIHGRMLVTCFQSHLEVFRSAFDNLSPGGYLGKTGSRGSVPSFLLLPEF